MEILMEIWGFHNSYTVSKYGIRQIYSEKWYQANSNGLNLSILYVETMWPPQLMEILMEIWGFHNSYTRCQNMESDKFTQRTATRLIQMTWNVSILHLETMWASPLMEILMEIWGFHNSNTVSKYGIRQIYSDKWYQAYSDGLKCPNSFSRPCGHQSTHCLCL